MVSGAAAAHRPARLTTGRDASLDEVKRSFLRLASHELRTPLNSVLGFSEIISRELHGPVGDPRYQEYAALIQESGHKLLKLVNQVIEIARLDAGAAELDLAAEAPLTAVQGAMRRVGREAAARDVDIAVRADEGLPLVRADARGLETALANLLQNAIAFSPEGGVVDVRVRAGRGSVLFEVRDRGEGVAVGELGHLTRPFIQGENALVRRTQGAGLGLSIVSLLCREMGGSLALRSSPGRGLTARIRLPSVEAGVQPLETERPAA